MSNYTEDMVEAIETAVEAAGAVTTEVISELCEELGVTERSLTAKMRSMNYDVPRKTRVPSFTEEETARFAELAEAGNNAEAIAEALNKSVRQVRGKALSMDITLTPSPKKEAPAKKFTDEEAELVATMAENGDYIEDIAEAVGKTVPQVRGKLLSMKLKAKQRDKKSAARQVIYTDEVVADIVKRVEAGETAAEISEATGLKLRGVQSRIGKLHKEGRITEFPSDMKVKSKTVVDYTPELLEEIAELAKTHTSQEAADELGISVHSLRAKAGREGIHFVSPKDTNLDD